MTAPRPRWLVLAGLPALIAAGFVWHGHAAKQEARADWQIGLAAADITPAEPVFLAGYASRDRAHEGVAAPLHAKALALQDADGHRAVILTTDLIGLTAEVAGPVCERITAATGIDRADILLSASHTHTGPMLTLSADPTTKMDASQATRQAAYTRDLQEKLAALAIEALGRCTQPARLSQATGLAAFVMNRREPTADRGVVLGVNPRGPVDRSVPALRITAPDGRLLAVLFQAACHNTTLGGDFYRISGDYAGYAQQMVEEAHPGVTALFTLGCAGDANPHPRGTLEMSEAHGRALGDEIGRLLADPDAWSPVSGPLTTRFAEVDLPLQPPPDGKALAAMKLQPGGSWRGFVASEIERRRAAGESLPTAYRAPFSVWQFSDDLTWIGLSGEVVVDYVTLLESALGGSRLWISAYCHDVYGYLPSARVLREGGYETRGLYAGGIGFFAPEAETVVAGAIARLARDAGRPESLFPPP
ncbi:MAG: neutral/alkaline non-lysosomal ceramidase N-terminal domain-containing protein [Verrucomicrobiales bacterium]|nr:neutral/alkaline non-lysosomal ceramidase N-terminal domain-containing protein [Verrucomicrobiales bacterium]